MQHAKVETCMHAGLNCQQRAFQLKRLHVVAGCTMLLEHIKLVSAAALPTSYAAGDDHLSMPAALQQGVGSAHRVEDAVNVGGKDVAPVVF